MDVVSVYNANFFFRIIYLYLDNPVWNRSGSLLFGRVLFVDKIYFCFDGLFSTDNQH